MRRDPALTPAAFREHYRDWYLEERDPIPQDRLRWRAQVFRQLVHLLPGQSILELGSGKGAFTRQLELVSRGENPVTASTLAESDLPSGPFDAVVGYDILDRPDAARIAKSAFAALAPGGQCVFFCTNPGNPILKLTRGFKRLTGKPDSRELIGREDLERTLAVAGFTGVFSVFTDFLYAPLTNRGARQLHDLSAVLQNTPGLRTFSGAMLAYGRKPGEPRVARRELTEHTLLHGGVSVVVPCHNEEMNIESLVNTLRGLYDSYIREIILVDDNSTDSTRAVIESLAATDDRVGLVSRKPPAGAGLALADGYRAATGDWILSLDADFEHLLPEVRDLFDAVADGADVAVGSRFSPDSVLINYPVKKIIANRGFHLLASLVLGKSFRDLTNNLKLMRREVAERLDLDQPGFALNAETGIGPLVLGYRVQEVPISWVGRGENMGASSFRLAAAGPGYIEVLRRLRQRRRAP